jgi:hypothetical protein
MASEMLTKITLSFKDSDLASVYQREKTDFFSKSLLIVSIMVGALALGLELAYNEIG